MTRRDHMNEWCEAEVAIYVAVQSVEAMGADRRLTEAINLLRMARHRVADFVDGITDVRQSMILSEGLALTSPDRTP